MQAPYPNPYSAIHELGAIFFIVSAVLFYFAFRVGRGVLAATLNLPNVSREIDLAKQPIPPKIQPLAQRLEAMGMQLIGAQEVKVRLLGKARNWIYLHPDGTVYAEMIELMNGGMAFYTWYPDNAFLYSSFPFGGNIQATDAHIRFTRRDPETAYSYHREQMGKWGAAHGQPETFTNLREIHAYSKIYHDLYSKRMTARAQRLGLINLGICLALGIDTLLVGLQIASVEAPTASIVDIGFQVALWAVCLGLGLYVQNQLKSPPGAIEG